ncbi:DUF7666 domain-containing protein [Paenibacillus bouchesdurhonensis]|uniref:DUF7666 domain-containing protein n=1 Tax=Paenibacillus bouchesdurhonensis TaxID=1870990 RepID=UPI000DA62210|nr:hypothetical protein [Paenibacillus bouchesdurhonensis]
MSIKGWKGFDKDLKCRGMQYEVGKTFEEQEAVACSKGLHFCENPLDVFGYYPPADSRYAEVEGNGQLSRDGDDSKVAATRLHIKAEIGLPGIIKAGVDYIKSKVDWDNAKESKTGDRSAATNTGSRSAATNTGYQSAATNTGSRSAATNTGSRSAATNTGDRSAATNTGYQSAATNTGDRSAATNTGSRSAATNTGDRSAASVEGKESVAMAIGYESKAKGAMGCWIVLAEWEEGDEGYHITDVQSAHVDGERIKPDTWYMLKNGDFVEVE